jgi:hypothetical protein
VLLWRIYVAGDSKPNLGLHVHCPIFLPGLNQIWLFSADFRDSPPLSNFAAIRPARAGLIHSDRQTDEQVEINGHFRKLCERVRKPWAIQQSALTPVRAVDHCNTATDSGHCPNTIWNDHLSLQGLGTLRRSEPG